MSAPEPLTDDDLVFADGIPGFPEHRRFQLVDFVGDSAFQLLQSVDDESMAMIVCSPWTFFPEYAPEIPDVDEEVLELTSSEDAIVFCPVSVEAPDRAFANLLGPFVVNAKTRQGRQVVLMDSSYEVRTELPIGAS